MQARNLRNRELTVSPVDQSMDSAIEDELLKSPSDVKRQQQLPEYDQCVQELCNIDIDSFESPMNPSTSSPRSPIESDVFMPDDQRNEPTPKRAREVDTSISSTLSHKSNLSSLNITTDECYRLENRLMIEELQKKLLNVEAAALQAKLESEAKQKLLDEEINRNQILREHVNSTAADLEVINSEKAKMLETVKRQELMLKQYENNQTTSSSSSCSNASTSCNAEGTIAPFNDDFQNRMEEDDDDSMLTERQKKLKLIMSNITNDISTSHSFASEDNAFKYSDVFERFGVVIRYTRYPLDYLCDADLDKVKSIINSFLQDSAAEYNAAKMSIIKYVKHYGTLVAVCDSLATRSALLELGPIGFTLPGGKSRIIIESLSEEIFKQSIIVRVHDYMLDGTTVPSAVKKLIPEISADGWTCVDNIRGRKFSAEDSGVYHEFIITKSDMEILQRSSVRGKIEFKLEKFLIRFGKDRFNSYDNIGINHADTVKMCREIGKIYVPVGENFIATDDKKSFRKREGYRFAPY